MRPYSRIRSRAIFILNAGAEWTLVANIAPRALEAGICVCSVSTHSQTTCATDFCVVLKLSDGLRRVCMSGIAACNLPI